MAHEMQYLNAVQLPLVFLCFEEGAGHHGIQQICGLGSWLQNPHTMNRWRRFKTASFAYLAMLSLNLGLALLQKSHWPAELATHQATSFLLTKIYFKIKLYFKSGGIKTQLRVKMAQMKGWKNAIEYIDNFWSFSKKAQTWIWSASLLFISCFRTFYF